MHSAHFSKRDHGKLFWFVDDVGFLDVSTLAAQFHLRQSMHLAELFRLHINLYVFFTSLDLFHIL